MLHSKLRLILFVGLVVLGSPTPARTNEASPSSWSEVRDAANTLLEQEKFDDALALIELSAPNLQDREF